MVLLTAAGFDFFDGVGPTVDSKSLRLLATTDGVAMPSKATLAMIFGMTVGATFGATVDSDLASAFALTFGMTFDMTVDFPKTFASPAT